MENADFQTEFLVKISKKKKLVKSKKFSLGLFLISSAQSCLLTSREVSKQSSQLARVRVTPGILITYSPSRTRSRRHAKRSEVRRLDTQTLTYIACKLSSHR